MKIGDRFITEIFHTTDDVDFIEEMNEYVGLECRIVDINYGYEPPIYKVIFNDRQSWWWERSALKPIKKINK